MTLANPQALWLLSLIPVVILIHSLKPKPRQVEVTALFLLEAAMSDRGGGINLRKILLSNLLLLLQILVILLAAAGLAEPVWEYQETVKSDVIMVVDTTASMKTRTGRGNRFDTARQQARALIDQLPSGSRMLIIEAGNKPQLKSAFSSDKSALHQVVDALQPTDVPGDLEKAVYLALSFARSGKKDPLYIITDITGEKLDRITGLYPHSRIVTITGGSDNVGITRFEFRTEPAFDNQYQIYLEIKNFNTTPVSVPLRLTVDRTLLIRRTVFLTAGQAERFILPYSGLVAGTARVSLDRPDDLDADNSAVAVLSRSREIWVLLVSKGNYYLERILSAYPNIKVNLIDRIVPETWDEATRQNDIIILDGIDFPEVDRGNFLMIASFSPAIPIRSTGNINRPRFMEWNKTHPVMQDLNLGGLSINEAKGAASESGAVVLMTSAESGLMYAYEKDQLKAVFLGFDPADSDLPYRVAFPVMMGNIIHWLYPDKLASSASQTRAGDPIPIHLDTPTEIVKIRRPSGIWERFTPTDDPFVYTRTDEVGLYTILENRKRYTFAVNLLSESESDIQPRQIDAVNEKLRTEGESATTLSQKSYWFFLFLLAAAALVTEWYIWLKRR